MKFLIYGLNYHPELVGIGKYTGELAQALAQKGHHVSVVTAPPYYPKWRLAEGNHAWQYTLEKSPNLRVTRCPLWVPKQPTGLRRIIHLISFAIGSSPVLFMEARKKPDLILAVAPALLSAPAAAMAGKIFSIPTWLHIQDFEVEAAYKLGILDQRKHITGYRLLSLVEKEIYMQFGRISSITHSMVRHLQAKGVSPAKTVFFPNWVDVDQIWPTIGKNGYHAQLGLDEACTTVLYSGSMGNKQGLEVVLETARRFEANLKLQFVLCGEGPAKPAIQAAAQGLSNVHFLPLQPPEKLNQVLNMADIHVLPQKRSAADLVMPSKLLGMLASGRPIVAGCAAGSELYEVISKVGVVVAPEDSEALTGALVSLAGDTAKQKDLGTRGRAYCIAHFDKETVIDQFICDAEKFCSCLL